MGWDYFFEKFLSLLTSRVIVKPEGSSPWWKALLMSEVSLEHIIYVEN
jgi:hypothetical protein